jgi:hypothetical protein
MEVIEKRPPIKLSEMALKKSEPGSLSYLKDEVDDKRPVVIQKWSWWIIVVPMLISLLIGAAFMFLGYQYFVLR